MTYMKNQILRDNAFEIWQRRRNLWNYARMTFVKKELQHIAIVNR